MVKRKSHEDGEACEDGDDAGIALKLIQQRDAARKAKDWTKADKLRDQLAELGVRLQDSGVKSEVVMPGGWKKIPREFRNVSRPPTSEESSAASTSGAVSASALKREKKKAKKALQKKRMAAEKEGRSKGAAIDKNSSKEKNVNINKEEGSVGEEKVLAKGVRVIELEEGTGPVVKERGKVRVAYVGRLGGPTGRIFDQSKGKPFSFRLGRGEVIKGWDIGVSGMRLGGRRRIICPPAAAYGAAGTDGIPGNSTLYFDVTAQ
uniref:peptidylprolyl isomerase n=1 Tax=Octactis speculum TaxID=3111310 RepID=A0A7S2B6J6_9STRA|mmetsp:Transcript_20058/g.27210  ORF Transcript_20058/g.27210 Transcript_20058/m.27210 type:complete len:262 (+) Transcript_20058:51-836(+)|eukprot:CAMPEP_0185772346 /NCGR_PEP_ID=MMETSP1174-20130828/68460_1 /TAXON_ID=35687 /ORGANISM="Dictyocha speculum, Strain CCMP1381" /LENGTH=261 /DNA_ID=CAMNT_0028458565 /DNA_START=50 /DNA_END=835 /DNA_ORIENTATION=+